MTTTTGMCLGFIVRWGQVVGRVPDACGHGSPQVALLQPITWGEKEYLYEAAVVTLATFLLPLDSGRIILRLPR
jgi:hypothetical protein